MFMLSRSRALAALMPLVCLSCVGHRLVAPDPGTTQSHDGVWLQQPRLKLDIVFMIDDSRSMADKQDNLVRNFPRFMRVLEDAVPAGSALDAHIGVVSSDLGIGTVSAGVDPCGTDGGKRGAFQAAPRGACAGPRGSYLITNEGGRNFDGDIADVFACIARLGTNGCGFEHQLASVRRALGGDPTAAMPPENAGFLRPDARLGIVLITDEDDCSAPTGSDLFTDDPAAEAAYGPRDSYRCNMFGHLCGGAPPPHSVVSGLSCEPNETATSRLIHVGELVDFFRGLKRDPDLLRVAAIAGPSTPYGTFIDPVDDVLKISPSCKGASGTDTGDGAPGVRLASFIGAFGDRGLYESICAPDFGPAMEHIARTLIPDLVPCVNGRLYDTDLARPGVQADCTVTEAQPRELQAPTDVAVRACDASGGATPCWRLGADARCGADGTAIVVDHGATAPADNTRAHWSCLVCLPGDTSPACAR